MSGLRTKRLSSWILALTLVAPLLVADSAQAGAYARYNRRLRNAERDLAQADLRAERRAIRSTYFTPVLPRTYVVPGQSVPGGALVPLDPLVVPSSRVIISQPTSRVYISQPTSRVFIGQPVGLNPGW
ncbi:hypothetical protein EP7_002837 [Isosphaeraceae bacterium EP7]